MTLARDLSLAAGMADAIDRDAALQSEGMDAAAAFWADGAPEVETENLAYPGAAGQRQALRLYRGSHGAPAPVLLYMHGGGWCGGSIALNESACRSIAADSGWHVISISYRLAPEHPYPAGLTDCRSALRWLKDHAPELGLDATRVALGGASAGANLALATALSEDRAPLAGLVLFYGLFGADTDTPSYRAHAGGPGLTRARVDEIFDLYDPDGRRSSSPLIAPLGADLAGLPPTCLIAAEIDVLRCDSEELSRRLAAAGVESDLHIEPGVTHGFINRGRMVPAARDCLARAARFLARIQGKSP